MKSTKPSLDYATMLEQLATTLPPGPAVILGLAAQAIRGGGTAEFTFGGHLTLTVGPVSIRCSEVIIRTEPDSGRGAK
ncbi:MAG: hypothetical protein KF873_02100 [Gemmataceae bacterium]|nr:hypothetical protein [Gemmataceae bacterium]